MKKEEIREIINDFCNEKDLSKSAFAKMCGVSDGTLSFIENGQWEKVSDEMAQKIKSFIDRKTGGDIYQSTDFVSIFKACDAARKFHLMIGVLGRYGRRENHCRAHLCQTEERFLCVVLQVCQGEPVLY